jgi:serine/threonine-protein kinase
MQAPVADRATEIVSIVATWIVVPLCIVGGVLLARRNLKLGRGDRRGAMTFASIIFALNMLAWVVGASHFGNIGVEQTRLAAAIASVLLTAVVFGLLYLAVEPRIRKVWPQLLITWTRLLGGRVRDPLLGRDLLVGAGAGGLMTLLTFAHYLLPDLFGWPPFTPAQFALGALLGPRDVIALIPVHLTEALENAVFGAVGLVLVRSIAPKKAVTFTLTTLLFATLAARAQIQTGRVWLDVAIGAVLVAIVLGAIVRWGFVAGAAAFFVHFLTKSLPATLEPDRLYFGIGLTSAAIAVGLAVAGFLLARAGRSFLDDD